MLSTESLYTDDTIVLLKAGNDLIVAGYASVELVDKQGDLITKDALQDGFKKFMEVPKYRNVQLAHSNIQVGEVIPNYTDSEGRVWKSEVDEVGMFVVIRLRDDIEKAKEVAAEIRKGKLRGFSIGGQAFKRVRKSDPKHGNYQEISKLELHEVTICEKGINPEATFRILKEDTEINNEVNNMTETENDDMTKQLGDVLARLEGRLDDMEKGLPPALKEAIEDKKNNSKDKDKGDDEKKASDDKDDKDKDKDDKEKSEFSDVITSDYLDWMEHTLKSGGIDIDGARDHFDKHNLGSDLKDDGAERFAAQVKGRAQEDGKPSTNAIARTTGKGSSEKVEKGDFLNASTVSDTDIEAAYEVYKAAALEQEFRGSLQNQFSTRYDSERKNEIGKAQAAAFDARGPLDEVMKAIGNLSDRLDKFATGETTEEGITIAKSESATFEIPSTHDMGKMSWDEVHVLADRAFKGE